jgi:uncharacterized heparinase superfamily protein
MTTALALQIGDPSVPALIASFERLSPTEIADHFAKRKKPLLFARVEPTLATDEWIEAALGGDFSFVGETHHLPADVDWLDNPSDDIEWHIALHKFYQAPAFAEAWAKRRDARCRDACIAQIASWMEQVTPGYIAADVTARRIQNWIYTLHLFGRVSDPLDGDFLLRMLESIETQVEWLRHHLHSARNHRTLELYAVFLAGVALPELRLAAEWRETALAQLAENATSDFLPDGVHCELSSHYHCISLRNFVLVLKLAQMNGIEVPRQMVERLRLARDFAYALTKPDGSIPAIGDADEGDYRSMLDESDRLLGAISKPDCAFFPHGGYYVQRGRQQDGECEADRRYLIFDCGPIGAGNHGHLDCLSIELAAYGRSLIVDPGRFSYNEAGAVNWRRRFRGTEGHSTVQVDAIDQTCYRKEGARFRICGPAPSAEMIRAEPTYFHGRARSAEYEAVHDRHIWFLHDRYWVILDRLTAAEAHQYDLRFQLHAGAQGAVSLVHDEQALVAAPHLQMAIRCGSPVEVSVDQGWVAPTYGVKHAAPVVRCRTQASSTWFAALIAPYGRERSQLALTVSDNRLVVSVDAFTDELPLPLESVPV